MTDPGYRHIVLVIDRSGSMRTKKEDTEGGIAQFLADQAGERGVRTSVSLYQFDSQYEPVYEMCEIGAAPPFVLTPRGSTALFDAIGRTVATTGAQLAAMAEDARPGSVILVVATDGHENASSDYRLDQVREMVTHQQEVYGWTVVFLGADQDAFETGDAIGVPRAQTLSYAGTHSGLAFAAASTATSRSLSGGGYHFTEAERAAAQDGTAQ